MTEEKKNPKNQLVTILSMALIAAAPGLYSAFQTSHNEFKAAQAEKAVKKNTTQAKREQSARDKQEGVLHKYVKALSFEIKAVKNRCVTHKDLLSVILRVEQKKATATPGGWMIPDQDAQRLYARIEKMRKKMQKAKLAALRVKAVKRPALKSSAYFRKRYNKSQ